MPRFNRVKWWSKNQARVQGKAISRLQQALIFSRLSGTLEPQDKSTSYKQGKVKKTVSATQESLCWLGHFFSNKPRVNFCDSTNTIHDTPRTGVDSKDKNAWQLRSYHCLHNCVNLVMYLFHRGGELSIWTFANFGTYCSPHTCFQPYREIPLTRDYKDLKKGKS